MFSIFTYARKMTRTITRTNELIALESGVFLLCDMNYAQHGYQRSCNVVVISHGLGESINVSDLKQDRYHATKVLVAPLRSRQPLESFSVSVSPEKISYVDLSQATSVNAFQLQNNPARNRHDRIHCVDAINYLNEKIYNIFEQSFSRINSPYWAVHRFSCGAEPLRVKPRPVLVIGCSEDEKISYVLSTVRNNPNYYKKITDIYSMENQEMVQGLSYICGKNNDKVRYLTFEPYTVCTSSLECYRDSCGGSLVLPPQDVISFSKKLFLFTLAQQIR